MIIGRNRMYEYTVQAFNSSDLGKVSVIEITVTAKSEAEALERAKQIVERTDYNITAIKELSREFKKG